MNRVISVNLGGNAYQLEEEGFNKLRAYLDDASARLKANPDRAEIIADIESSIAERFNGYLKEHKNVILSGEVDRVLKEMGPVEADDDSARADKTDWSQNEDDASAPTRKLYRLKKGAMLTGVCNGLGAYLDIDQTIIRLAFIAVTLFFGVGVFVYLIMSIVIPEATTPEEIASATTGSSTAREFIQKAREGYYESLKQNTDRRSRREWKRRVRKDMREQAWKWKYEWKNQWNGYNPHAGFFLPVITALYWGARIIIICAMVSLLADGAILGKPIPFALPVWGAFLILLLFYALIIPVIKSIRHSMKMHLHHSSSPWGTTFVINKSVKIALIVISIMLIVHYLPNIKMAIAHVPANFHAAENDITAWWNK
jgi:phage shock protein PspC (stress-responsive transcriptional regulator)